MTGILPGGQGLPGIFISWPRIEWNDAVPGENLRLFQNKVATDFFIGTGYTESNLMWEVHMCPSIWIW